MFKGTPYEHDALGTRPSFDQTSGVMLQKFHDTWYRPNNGILVIVGEVQPEDTLAEVKKLFGGIPADELPRRAPFNFKPSMLTTSRQVPNVGYPSKNPL